MIALRAVHLIGLIAWLGGAGADIVLELALTRERAPEGRAALIRLHRAVDLALEGPGILVTLSSGLLLLSSAGLLGGGEWPDWLAWKVGCGGVAAAANLACVGFVLARARAAESSSPGSAATHKWTRAVWSTGIGVPFALAALWLALAR
ncbi:MAG: hypothetical protein HYZ28_03640 [Myxococcales bacterium]|nr:hypothetical protein [Myxococcales bacterium]